MCIRDSNMNPALASLGARSPHRLVTPLDRVHVVLSHPSHPGNIGAAARAMKTMGLSHLTLVNPKRFPDDEAIARAAGAEDVLVQATVCESLELALSDTIFAVAVSARHRNLGPEPMQARQAAAEILAQTESGKDVYKRQTHNCFICYTKEVRIGRCRRVMVQPPVWSSNLDRPFDS